jgi:NAD(P)-dependent dehydrogenase (short-subunit alcohol dehydrogenase family)
MSDKGQKVAIIIGGSQGIGASLVTAYRRQGWSVVATARTMTPTEDPDVLTVDGDLADPATASRHGVLLALPIRWAPSPHSPCRIFTSLRRRPPLPYRAPISPFGATLSPTRYRWRRAAPAAIAPRAVMGTRPFR